MAGAVGKMVCFRKIAIILAGVLACCAGVAQAASISFTGNLSDPNQVQLFNFSVSAPATVTLRTWSYAGGTNAQGTLIAAGGFDPLLALFSSSGTLINDNDDGVGVAIDPLTGGAFDSLISTTLLPGTYTASIMASPNFAVGPNFSNGFENNGSFTDFTGASRDSRWALDLINVDSAEQITSAAPEPASWLLMLGGFGLAGALLRRRAGQRLRAAA